MSWLDIFLSDFRWYRKWVGGTWRHVYALPWVQGGFEFWTRARPVWYERVLYTEYWPL